VRGEDGATVTETVTIKTLAIRWGEELRPAADHRGAKERKKSISELALAALSDLISKSGVPLPAGCAAPEGLRGALEEAWRLELVTGGVIAGAGKPGTAFGNVKRVMDSYGFRSSPEGRLDWAQTYGLGPPMPIGFM
jgi:hypothetical protein